MVSNSDNPNFLFMEPFIKWIQEVYQNTTRLRIYKRMTNTQKFGSYCVLTNIGKKKTDDPITVYCKLKKINISNLSFEIYDTIVKIYIYFEAHGDTFDFGHRGIDEETIKNCSNYVERPFLDDQISEDKLQSNVSSPAPTPPSTAGTTTTLTSASTFPPSQSLSNEESRKEIALLRKELERSACENFMLVLERDSLMKKLSQNTSPNQLNINQFNVVKLLTYSLGVKVYTVEQIETKKKFNLKEVILDPYFSKSTKLLDSELKTLSELAKLNKEVVTGRGKHICHLLGTFEDCTIIRRSHYIVTEPALLNLEDFASTYMKVSKKLLPIVITQILKGLDYLDTTIRKVHGNIDLRSIVVDSNWTVKLTNFEMTRRIGEEVDPIEFLNGESDLLIKHPHLFEKIEKKQPVTVGYWIDNWAIGCLFYKLITNNDLFIRCTHHRDHMSIASKLVSILATKAPGVPIGTFFHDASLEISPGAYFQSDYFKSYHNEDIGRHVQAAEKAAVSEAISKQRDV